jgi:L-rhamnose mutarotase
LRIVSLPISLEDFTSILPYMVLSQRLEIKAVSNSRHLTYQTDSIFYDDASHILFASMKYVGYDYDGDMEKMREDVKVREWWKMTDSYQESVVEGAKSSEAGGVDGVPSWWKGLEEVFYFP